jgi:hypothetical protein
VLASVFGNTKPVTTLWYFLQVSSSAAASMSVGENLTEVFENAVSRAVGALSPCTHSAVALLVSATNPVMVVFTDGA